MIVKSQVTLSESPEVKGTAISVPSEFGVAESIRLASSKSMARAASYHLAIARILNPQNDGLWRNWFNVNNEAVKFEATKSYRTVETEVPPGKYLALIVNGQTFSRDHEGIKAFIRNEGTLDDKSDLGLVAFQVPISRNYADSLLGKKTVYAFSDGEIKNVEVPIFTVDEYKQAQQDKNFLLKNPVFVGLFTEEQAAQYAHHAFLRLCQDGKYSPDQKLIGHVPSHMQSGTKEIWAQMLQAASKRNYDSFYVGMPNLSVQSGRVGVVEGSYYGYCYCDTYNDGRSISVTPEACDTLVKCLTSQNK